MRRHLNPGPQEREARVQTSREKFLLDCKINLSEKTKPCEGKFCNTKTGSETQTELVSVRNIKQSDLQL